MTRHSRTSIRALAILVAGAFAPSARADLFSTIDVNPDPDVFECVLTSRERDVTIAGSTVHAFVFKDESAAVPPASAGMPIQVIKLKVGDMVICHFENHFTTESASIHWHGIELDNDSDGTAVTQDAVLPGQSYTYMFKTFRPGIFWFHSHMLPGNTLFGGMYGVIIIENDIEASLKGTTLPADADTYTLALSDITFDASGFVSKPVDTGGGVIVNKTLNELVELCHLYGIGDTGGLFAACNASATPGTTVLVNGKKPDTAVTAPKFVVPSGKRIRLRLLNESISRHFRLRLKDSGDNKLYRIGGQGGLLDNVILEGGIKGTWDTKYNEGEIVLASGMRADVIVVPSGAQGAIIPLVGNPLPDPFKLSTSLPPDYPIAFFQISGTSTDAPPAAGDPILEGTAEDVENIKTGVVINPLLDPAPSGGSSDETIKLTTETPTGPGSYATTTPAIDQFAAMLDSNTGNGDWLTLLPAETTRYAHVGDVLELVVKNDTNAVHPFHLHGFSMQPVRVLDDAGTTLYEYDYDEFLDTIDVLGSGGSSSPPNPGQALVFRVRLDDRQKICDEAPSYPPGPVLASCSDADCSGAVGRWLFHCHILNHGALGMIGELDVLPAMPKPDELDGPCCTLTVPSLPAFQATSLPGLGACWDHCAQNAQRTVQVEWDVPSQPVCTEYSTNLQVFDGISGLPLLSGPMVLDYTRTWTEVPPTGPPIQVWRFTAKADLAWVPGGPVVNCPVPPCLPPVGPEPTAFFYGYVDYAACSPSGPWWNVLVLNHAPDRFIHAPGLSDKPGVFHPFQSYAIIAPHSPAQPFVPGNALAPGGALVAEAMRNINVPFIPTDVCLVEDPVFQANMVAFGGGCMATIAKNPKQYTLRQFTGESVCLDGGGEPGAWASLNIAFPVLPWYHLVSTSMGSWSNPNVYPGLESAWVDEGLFVHLDQCTGDVVELKYGGSTRDGWPAMVSELMVNTFTDLADNYSAPIDGPYPSPILGSIRPTEHLIYVNR